MSEERFDRIEQRLDRLETGQKALHDDLGDLGQQLRMQSDDLGRQMRVLHEDLVDRIDQGVTRAGRSDSGGIRRTETAD